MSFCDELRKDNDDFWQLSFEHPFVQGIVSGTLELAQRINADGVHIEQEEQKLSFVRKKLPHGIVGVSVHNLEEVDLAIAGGADYVGIGPSIQHFLRVMQNHLSVQH